MNFKEWLKKIMSSDPEASMKRTICFIAFILYGVQHFLVMYLKTEAPNKDLILNSQDGLFWLVAMFGGLVAFEPLIARAKLGGPRNIIHQDVEKQTVNTDEVTVEKKTE